MQALKKVFRPLIDVIKLILRLGVLIRNALLLLESPLPIASAEV